MNPYTISDEHKLIIISANSGGRGWKMARLTTCYEYVYWYKSKSNGEYPWTLPDNFECDERRLAKMHFDRKMPCGNIAPLFGYRVSRFWDDDGWKARWRELYDKLQKPTMDEGQCLVYVSHEDPKTLREWFPNACIFCVYDKDSSVSAYWHLQTSAEYRIDHHFSGMKPDYRNNYQKTLDWIIEIRGDEAKFKDIWMYETHDKLEWNEELIAEYTQHELKTIDAENTLRYENREHADLTTTWDDFHVDLLKPFLGDLDANHTKILSPPQYY